MSFGSEAEQANEESHPVALGSDVGVVQLGFGAARTVLLGRHRAQG